MATIHFRDIAKTAILNAIKTDIDAGAAAGKLRIYMGTMPATPGDAITGGDTGVNMLAELTLSYPMGAITGAGATLALEFGAVTQDSAADHTGAASFFRVFRNDGSTGILDGDVTITGSGGTLQLNTTSIVLGGPVLVNSFKISVP